MHILLLLFVSLSYASITEPHVKWEKNNITVCWGDKEHFRETYLSREDKPYKMATDDFLPYTSYQKNIIQTAVNTEYTPERTGIHFTGWKDCHESLSESDVVLLRVEKTHYPEGSASLANGVAERNYNASYPIAIRKNHSRLKRYVLLKTYRDPVILKKVSDDESLIITTIHEFGHIGGLRHEHADQDQYRNDPNCKRQGYRSGDFISSTSRRTSSYDTNSIMSYCFMLHRARKVTGLDFKARNQFSKLYLEDETLFTSEKAGLRKHFKVRIGLSKKDIHALKCLYVYDDVLQKKVCHRNYEP